MAKKQDWSPRRPQKALVTIELVVAVGEESDLESVNVPALQETVRAYLQHGTFSEGLSEALDSSPQPLDIVSYRVRTKPA